MSPVGKVVRPALRFVASVLMTSGVMMLADAALTVTWQEPVSAFIAAREQGGLDDELDDARAELGEAEPGLTQKQARKRIKRLAGNWSDKIDEADAFGRIELPSLGRDYAVVEGTKLKTLRAGPGHYPKTPLPGEGGTIAIAGHRTTYGAPFRTIDKLEDGDEIIMDMPYGTLTYEVEKQQIVPPTALWITDRVPGRERLVLSACHPLYSAAKRIVVFARLKEAKPV